MSELGIPKGYHSVQAYMIVDGAERAIEFYAKALGAKQRLMMKGPDGKVGHAEIELGDSVIMLADENPQVQAQSAKRFGGSPVSFMVYLPDCDAVYKQALASGAKSVREPADQPYGVRMAAVEDPFGYKWFLGTQIKDMTKEELENLK
jgi:PhnB protein